METEPGTRKRGEVRTSEAQGGFSSLRCSFFDDSGPREGLALDLKRGKVIVNIAS